MADQKRSFYDSATFWAIWGALAVVIGGIFVAIAGDKHRLANVWWDLGIGLLVVGVLALWWSLTLFVAHRYAKDDAPTAGWPSALTITDNTRIGTRQVRAAIATCRMMIEEAIKIGLYPWSSFDHKLPVAQWSLQYIVLALDPNSRDAFQVAAMAYGQFDRINRLVTDMQVSKPEVRPEHRLDAVVTASEAADHALTEFDHTLTTPYRPGT